MPVSQWTLRIMSGIAVYEVGRIVGEMAIVEEDCRGARR
jgi:hypothetical protein